MKKLLFLCVISMSTSMQPSEERKPITAKDLVAHSVEYTVRNPLLVSVASYLIINQMLNGNKSIICNSYRWVTITIPKVIMNDCNKLRLKSIDLQKKAWEFISYPFIKKNPQAYKSRNTPEEKRMSESSSETNFEPSSCD